MPDLSLPWNHPVFKGAYAAIEEQSDKPDTDHADDDAGEINAIGVEDKHHLTDTARAAAARLGPDGKFRGDDRGPGNTKRQARTDEQIRQRTRQNDGTENREMANTECAGRTDQARIDAANTMDCIHNHREKSGIANDEDGSRCAGTKPENGEWQECDRRNWSEAFDDWVKIATNGSVRRHRGAQDEGKRRG